MASRWIQRGPRVSDCAAHSCLVSVDPMRPLTPARLCSRASARLRACAVRTGIVESDSGSLLLERGEEVTLVTDEALRDKCSKECIFVDHPGMPALLRPDNTVFMDDGLLALRVVKASDQEVKCVVENGGSLGSRKGVNLPGVAVDLPSVSKRDEADLQFARDNKVDFVFASFVRKAQHVHEIREIVGPSVQVVSKIENQQGLDNYDEILEASDGIMVARGDLGIEIPAERVVSRGSARVRMRRALV